MNRKEEIKKLAIDLKINETVLNNIVKDLSIKFGASYANFKDRLILIDTINSDDYIKTEFIYDMLYK